MLQSLTLRNLGPAPELDYEFGEWLNIVNGDKGRRKAALRRVAGEFLKANGGIQE
jgi:hypothetical protein